VERWRLSDTGDVGIGTTSPDQRLSIAGNAAPSTNDNGSLGVSGTAWSDLFLASGGVINFNAGDVRITHSSNALTFDGGTFYIFSDGVIQNQVSGTQAGLNLIRTDAHGSAQTVGLWQLFGKDSAANTQLYARLIGVAVDATSGSEDGRLSLGVVTNGTFTDEVALDGTSFIPLTDARVSLGLSSLGYTSVFLSSDGVINFNSGNVTITHSAGALAVTGVTTVASTTATPAGGSTSARLLFGTTAGFGVYYGSGAPTVSAAQGSLYMRSDGAINARLYINTNGSTTWTAFNTTS
jgi:hypothetical protein